MMRRTLVGSLHGLTLLLSDLAAVSLATLLGFAIASLVSEGIFGEPFVLWAKALKERIPVLLPLLVALAAWLHGRGRYAQRQPFWSETRDVLAGCLLAFVVEGFIQYAMKEHVSRLWIAGTWAAFPVVATLLRAWMKGSLAVLGARNLPVLVLGAAGARQGVVDAIRGEESIGWSVVAEAEVPADGGVAALVARAGAQHVIVVGQPDERLMPALRELSSRRISYALCLPVAGSGLASMRPVALVGHDFLLLGERPGLASPVARVVKRASDIGLALVIGLVSLPVALLAALLVALDGGPVLYGQERIGRGGRTFRCLKLRTMVVDSDARLAALLASDPEARMEWERDRKLRRDPRITWAGRFLRSTAIDEWPQLFNVLRGDMSFVGPRPVTSSELCRYGDDLPAYLDVRPGLTGLWQASGRNDLSYERRVSLDAWYVRNWSAWLDFVVLMKTVPALLARRGAY